MDPLSLSSLGAVGLGYAIKFLFDRGNAALDRRAERRAVSDTSPTSSSVGDYEAIKGTGSAVERIPTDVIAPARGVVGDARAEEAERELTSAMRVLEVYRAKGVPLDPQDQLLVDALERTHAALEQLEGAPVDLPAAVRSLIEVDQEADHVHGTMTGAEIDAPSSGTSTHVRQRFGTVHDGGNVTGYRAGGQR
ncbi:hypothetical protein [Saccharopolyspora sp. NPDC050642]|uniref:hypothetical protein n=1 Tax=Saccharopolyspora sp. NPDC050642 TaxID=3157099 RepID=UPI0033F2D422